MTATDPELDPYAIFPDELKERRQWVTWDYEQRGDKPTKVPRNPNGAGRASSTDPETWGTFDEVALDLAWGHRDGVGFVFTEDDNYFFIDLDHALDIDMVTPEAGAVIDRFSDHCYIEWSPSGQGLHLIGRGVLPPGGNRKGAIEVYDRGRFATMTGNVYDSRSTIGADCTDELAAWHAEIFQPIRDATTQTEAPPELPPLTDDELIAKALGARNGEKLRRLLNGDDTGYESASEADSATIAMLGFYTTDASQIERVLRLSARQRDKWDEHPDYLQRSIGNALDILTEHYEPTSNVIDFRTHLKSSGGDSGDDEAETMIAGVRMSDLGNAQRLAQRITGEARYCWPAKHWYRYDGRRWDRDTTGWITRAGKKSVLSMYALLETATDYQRKALTQWANRSESERSINAAISLARSEDDIPVMPEAFDHDTMVLNTANGTLDLRTGGLRPHDPADMISKLAPVTHDPEATCPKFLAFLDQIFEGDQERIDYIQRLAGYSMTGLTSERVVVVLWGVGRNGKSTLLRTLSSVMGEYAKHTSTETLMLKRGDSGPSNDLAALRGARLVTASETEEGKRLNVSRVKDMSGDEPISARFLYGEWFEFRPQFTIWLSTNHKPSVPGNDQALFDRLRLVPFTYRTPEEKVDKSLEAQFMAEAAGILNWMIAGCLAWQEGGLQTPQSVADATDEYRTEMDALGSWMADRCVLGDDKRAPAGDLYGSYKGWSEANGERQKSATWFGRQLKERGFEQTHEGPKRTRTWNGIALLDNNDKVNGLERFSGNSTIGARAGEEFSETGVQPVLPVHQKFDDVNDGDDGGWQ